MVLCLVHIEYPKNKCVPLVAPDRPYIFPRPGAGNKNDDTIGTGPCALLGQGRCVAWVCLSLVRRCSFHNTTATFSVIDRITTAPASPLRITLYLLQNRQGGAPQRITGPYGSTCVADQVHIPRHVDICSQSGPCCRHEGTIWRPPDDVAVAFYIKSSISLAIAKFTSTQRFGCFRARTRRSVREP